MRGMNISIPNRRYRNCGKIERINPSKTLVKMIKNSAYKEYERKRKRYHSNPFFGIVHRMDI
jgi:hypothetical protein